MSFKVLEYPLVDRFIHNWLVTDAWFTDFSGPRGSLTRPEWKQHLLAQVSRPSVQTEEEPVDRGNYLKDDSKIRWHYTRCFADHLVLVSGNAPLPAYGCAFAHAGLTLPEAGAGELTLWGQVGAVWLNGAQVYESASLAPVRHLSIPVAFQTVNTLAVRIEWAAEGAYAASMALRVAAPRADEALVRLNTKSRYPDRHKKMEEVLDKAHLVDVVSEMGKVVNLVWDESATEELRYAYQVQDDQENIYVDGSWDLDASKPYDVGHPVRLAERSYRVVLKSPSREYFEMGMRYQRDLPLEVVDNSYSDAPYGPFASRRQEALEDAARRNGSVFYEAAKMALERWDKVEWSTLETAAAGVQRSENGRELELVGLLSLVYRHGQAHEFKSETAGQIEQAAWNFDYALDRFPQESSRALALCGALLAGQLYPEVDFIYGRLKGEALRAQAEAGLLELLPQKGKAGFEEWGSGAAYERWVVALTALASLARNEAVSELAAVLLDKLLYMLAVGHFKGVPALPQRPGGRLEIKSGRLNPIAGVQRMLWGMGIFTRHAAGTVSLACADYEFPSFFADLAAETPNELEVTERHQAAGADAELYLYKTPDTALSCVQSYRSGETGGVEHIWQAVLGTEALAFTNHPASMHETDAPDPGFWLGNAVLPTVAQYKDTLVAIYNLPEDAWLGFTHAYFPVHAFDEYRFEDGWAFARKGRGYLALFAEKGFHLTKLGVGAYTELRSEGRQNAWVCVTGREAQYEDFRAFQKKVLKMPLSVAGLSVNLTTIQGVNLALEWGGRMKVNGVEQPPSSCHLQSPYCTAESGSPSMDIHYAGTALRLNFA